MQPRTAEWIEKAELDYDDALYLSRKPSRPSYSNVCFHCQQAAEKYLKAVLEEAGLLPEYTHNLVGILQAVLPHRPMWTGLRPALQWLSGFAVAPRYPEETAGPADVARALRIAGEVRLLVRESFGLD